jgi:uncharacterized membrane protein YdjX (TVP38/TMEM64 family)
MLSIDMRSLALPNQTYIHMEDQTIEANTEESEEKLGQEVTRSMNKERRKVIGLVIGLAVFMAIARFTPLSAWITNVQVWKAYIRDLGHLAHGMFLCACAAAVMIGIPRLPLCAAAGLIFGFTEGLLISLIGSTLGSYGAFLITRKGARRSVQARLDQWPWLLGMMNKPSLGRVFWVRQLMVPGIVLNMMLGVTSIGHRLFLLGTALGYLPLNVTFALVGSGLGKGSFEQTLTQLLGAMGLINIIGWLVWRMKNKRS